MFPSLTTVEHGHRAVNGARSPDVLEVVPWGGLGVVPRESSIWGGGGQGSISLSSAM